MYHCSMYSKELMKGTLEVIILRLLSDNKRMYGYEITQQVKIESDGKLLIKEGSLYPALHKLLDDGVLTFEEEMIGKRVRKYYSLTSKGEERKVALLEEMDSFLNTMRQVIFNPPSLSPNVT